MLFGGAIQNAIFLYIILVIVLFILKPKLLEQKDQNGKQNSARCILPIALVIIAIVCYYFFASIELHYS
tara:strand:- start:268 stop:474 length:207 start_codon:yes stop_codon:yes gene_type:complete